MVRWGYCDFDGAMIPPSQKALIFLCVYTKIEQTNEKALTSGLLRAIVVSRLNRHGRARSAGGHFVQGAEVVVTSLTRSVRYIVPIGENGTGDPSPTRMFDYAVLYRKDS